jgi:hypothetical protein
MMRRGLSLGFALAMAAAAPLPMLACDLPTSGMDCHPARMSGVEPQSQHCETDPAKRDAAPADPAPRSGHPDDDADYSCCVLAPAQVPEAPGKTDAPAPAAAPDELVVEAAVAAPAAEPRAMGLFSPIVSPPDRQPVLCTFLI